MTPQICNLLMAWERVRMLNDRFRRPSRMDEQPQRKSGFLKVFRCGPWCNISFSRGVRPALTNLGRRIPRGLGVTYGERARAGEAAIATGALLTVSNAPAAVLFCHPVPVCCVDWVLSTQRRSSFWMLAASVFSQSAKDDRNISKRVGKHRIMLPALLVASATSVSDRAGRSR